MDEEVATSDEYTGHWMETYTGKQFHFLCLQKEELDIVDIAHHLSQLCRYTGACRTFYSVAEHSVRVSHIVSPGSQLAALMHDSAEAYTNDMSRPMKHLLPQVGELESKILTFIYDAFHITDYDWDEIKSADNIIGMTEARDLMTNSHTWRQVAVPLPSVIVPMPPKEAEFSFLARYKYLAGDRIL